MFLAAKQRGVAGGVPVWAAACFAAGLAVGALVVSGSALRTDGAVANVPPLSAPANAALRSGHPAEVLRVFDGDTFEARVRVWPGMDITTRVRLRAMPCNVC